MTLLTLDWFSRTMRYPALNFMGLTTQAYECSALDCYKRNTYVQIAKVAEDMIEMKARESDASLHPRHVHVSSSSPVVWLRDHSLKRLIEHTEEGVPIVYSPILEPEGMATLTFTVNDVSVCEEFISVEAVFAPCACMRLGIEWCSVDIVRADVAPVSPATVVTLQDWTFTLTARAYNFLALDSEPVDDLLSTVTVKVKTAEPSSPAATFALYGCGHTASSACDDSCATVTSCDACIQITGDVGLIQTGSCVCVGQCVGYEYDLFSAGIWQTYWQEAIISLMNTMLPIDYCVCEAITNERWAVDRGERESAIRLDASNLWNPFGIAMPGAHRAWFMVEPAMSQTQVWG